MMSTTPLSLIVSYNPSGPAANLSRRKNLLGHRSVFPPCSFCPSSQPLTHAQTLIGAACVSSGVRVRGSSSSPAMQHSLFPAFRSRFVPEAAWTKDTYAQEGVLQGPEDASSEPLVRMAGYGGPAAAGRGALVLAAIPQQTPVDLHAALHQHIGHAHSVNKQLLVVAAADRSCQFHSAAHAGPQHAASRGRPTK